MEFSPDLKEDLVDGYTGRPMVEQPFSFAHSHLRWCENRYDESEGKELRGKKGLAHFVAADENANIARDPLVQTIPLTPQPLLDCVLGNLEVFCADSAMVIPHAKSVIAPDHSRALGGAARWNSRPPLHHPHFPAELRLQPRGPLARRREQPCIRAGRSASS